MLARLIATAYLSVMTAQSTFPPVYESFVAPARRRPAIWRLVLGLILAAAIYMGGTFGLLGLVWWLTASQSDFLTWSAQVAAPSTPFFTYLILFVSFPMMAAGVFVAAKVLHKRGPGTLFGRAPRVMRHFCVGAAVTAAISLVVLIPSFVLGFDGIPNVPARAWLMLLPLTLLGVLVQTGAEELVFRGYLQQQLAARFRSPFLWLLIPAAVFALVHWNPAALGDNVWLPLAVAFLFGLAAADLTAKTGSIGAAWGIHFANNFNGIALIATDGTITGLSLYLTPYSASDPDLVGWSVLPSMVLLAAAWFVTRRLTAR
ncbi:MAG: type II CAAX endopeptidase family protein [Pseudomonadota bacterium]